MSVASRRRFLKQTGITTATAALLSPSARAAGKSDPVRVGVIGCGNQGSNHIRSLFGLSDAQIVHVADIDSARLTKALSGSGSANGVADFRRILDNAGVDAVTIATPDHWPTRVALLALDAGKHVYVEKPCSHNVREGQLLVAAARKHNRVVAHGTQSRSSPAIQQAITLLRNGVIGDVLLAKWFHSDYSAIGAACAFVYAAGMLLVFWAPNTAKQNI